MQKRLGFLLVLLLVVLFGSQVSQAQETTDTPDAGWPVVERCVGEPTKPPKGWSYDGTILMTGYAGIHGVNAKWDTPRVLAKLSDKDVWGGAISPDGKWYASPYGEVFRTQSNNVITDVNQIYVYRLMGNNEKIIVDWSQIESYQMTYAQIYWRDNENFTYLNNENTLLINPFSGKQSIWPEPGFIYDANDQYRSQFAPDWSRVIYTQPDNETGERIKHLYALPANDLLARLAIEIPVSWKPDSSGFLATIVNQESLPSTSELVLFDRYGKLLKKLTISKERFSGHTLGWSNDSRYFAFISFAYSSFETYSPENRLYIADIKEQKIIDTCLTIGEGMAWSPNHNLLTFFEPKEGLKRVLILDMISYKLYGVANHLVGYDYRIYQGNYGASDRILGWRED